MNKTRTDIVLDFLVHLGRQMLESGANLERVNISIRRVCKCYQLKDMSVLYANSVLSVGLMDTEGQSYVRQEFIPYTGIHLMRLGKLNLLVHDIMNNPPEPDKLLDMLYEALLVKTYSNGIQIMGYIMAMYALCRIFGGCLTDIIVAVFNTVVLYYLMIIFQRAKLNRIISNVVAMLFCGCSAILAVRLNFAVNLSAIIITNAFYLIPGIPMVNAVRNIFCGNEMNGIIEMVKVLLEVVTIVAGLYIASLLFGADVISMFR